MPKRIILYQNCITMDKVLKSEIYHTEEAAMKGHTRATHNLGFEEVKNGRFERARKHFIIGFNLGLHESLQALRELYAEGHASKEDYAAASVHIYQALLRRQRKVQIGRKRKGL